MLKELFKIVSVASVTEQEIQKAMELEWKDFEDSVQYSVVITDFAVLRKVLEEL